MTMYNPDRWVVIKNPHCYKVFATWSGGYTHGSSWKLNSGITHCEQDGDYLVFHGYSGSTYRCHKDLYGITGGWHHLMDTPGFEIVPETTDFVSMNYGQNH